MKKRLICALLTAVLLLSGCALPERSETDDGKLQVVCSLFPYYDIARAIGGEYVDAKLLVPAGRETHSFEPTPLDVITMSRADVLIYNGGHGEFWVEEMLGAAGEDIGQVVRMMDYVDPQVGEVVEGMEEKPHAHPHSHLTGEEVAHDHDHHDSDHEEPCPAEHLHCEEPEFCEEEHYVHHEDAREEQEEHDQVPAGHLHCEDPSHCEEPHHHHDSHDDGHAEEIHYDEHIWTSPENAMILCRATADALSRADPAHADAYEANLQTYLTQLEELDAAFRDTVAHGKRNLVVFGDRFPMLYFCKTYGLEYRAAFHGCAGDTEPSLNTLKYLIDKVEEEEIPIVYTIELSSQKIANVIAESTGAEVRMLHSCQTVSREEFDRGESYLSLMWNNVDALKEGLS